MADKQLVDCGVSIEAAYEGQPDTNKYTTADKNKLSGIQAGAQVNTVNSVNGDVGNVTITAADVGLGNVTNTSDENKPVSTAQAEAILNKPECIIIVCSDLETDLTTGITKGVITIPYNFLMVGLPIGNIETPATGTSKLTLDLNKNGASILSTKLTFDSGEDTTVTASVPCVVTDSTFPAGTKLTVDIDQIGSTIAGKGVSVTIVGHQT